MLWSPNGEASAEITIRDTYSKYEFSGEPAIRDWVEATIKAYCQEDAYFELIRSEQKAVGQLPEWYLEYCYRNQAGEPLLWAKHRLLFERWRQYDVAVQVSEEDSNCYLKELNDILESFMLRP